MGAVRKTESNITSDYLSDVIYTHKINEAQTNRRNNYKNRNYLDKGQGITLNLDDLCIKTATGLIIRSLFP